MKTFLTAATRYFGHNLALVMAEKGSDADNMILTLQSPFVLNPENIQLCKSDIAEKDSRLQAILK